MKPLSFSALLLLVVLITGACKKIPVINQTNSNISFKIDGVSKTARGDKNVFALYSKEQTIIQIIGNISPTGDQLIALTINNFHGLGEYTAEEDFLGLYNTPELDQSIIGTEGKIRITEYTEGKSIKGEFQFKGEAFIVNIGTNDDTTEARIFSDGKFEAKVSDYSGPILAP